MFTVCSLGNAAELLANLFTTVIEEIVIKFSHITLWSDSSIVLSWINTQPNRLNTYVANRVSRIQTLTKTCEWKLIRGEENPADLLSRGCNTQELVNSVKW
jgi:hypothetical protein